MLYGRVKPLFKLNKHAEDMEKLEAELKVAEEIFVKEEESRKAVEAEHSKLAEARNKLQEVGRLIC